MCQALWTCGAQEVRCVLSEKTSAYKPGGARGVLSITNYPFISACAGSLRLIWDDLISFMVSSACGSISYQSLRGFFYGTCIALQLSGP